MKWYGQTLINEAQGRLSGTPQGVAVTVAMGTVPENGDGPQRNDLWILERIYLPYSVIAEGQSTTPANVQVSLTLTQGSTVLWATSNAMTLLDNNVNVPASVASAIAAEDFNNPIRLDCGASPLTLAMSATFDQNVTTCWLGVACQFTAITNSGNSVTATPAQGTITYTAISLDDPDYASS